MIFKQMMNCTDKDRQEQKVKNTEKEKVQNV